jgi:pimeloyl-ACP methyl ester carboxylesterase
MSMRFLVVLGVCTLLGCTPLHKRIAEPEPLQGSFLRMERMLVDKIGIRSVRFDAPGQRQLHYLSLEPGDYGFEPRYQDLGNGFSFGFETGEARPAGSPTATVILLHGWSMGAISMFPWLLGLAEHSLRTVALDLRGHGRSDRAPVGYGPREAEDVLALVEYLEATGQLQEPIYLLGVSYGAATAAFASERLQGRVAGTILIAPYSNAAEGIASGVAGLLALQPQGLGQRALRNTQRARYDTSRIEEAIDRASNELGLDLRTVNVGDALEGTESCVLLLHGALDRLIPLEAARELARRGQRVQLVEFPDDGHFSLPFRVDWLTGPLAEWMAGAADQACPTLQLPENPAFSHSGADG